MNVSHFLSIYLFCAKRFWTRHRGEDLVLLKILKALQKIAKNELPGWMLEEGIEHSSPFAIEVEVVADLI